MLLHMAKIKSRLSNKNIEYNFERTKFDLIFKGKNKKISLLKILI